MSAITLGAPAPAPERLPEVVTMRQLCDELLGCGRTTVYRLLADEDSGFPPPIRITRKRVGFDREAVRAWVRGRQSPTALAA